MANLSSELPFHLLGSTVLPYGPPNRPIYQLNLNPLDPSPCRGQTTVKTEPWIQRLLKLCLDKNMAAKHHDTISVLIYHGLLAAHKFTAVHKFDGCPPALKSVGPC